MRSISTGEREAFAADAAHRGEALDDRLILHALDRGEYRRMIRPPVVIGRGL